MISQDLLSALPEVFMACAGMALLMVGVFRGGNPTRSPKSELAPWSSKPELEPDPGAS